MNLTSTPIKKELNLEDSPYLLDEYGPVFILGCPRSGTTFLSSCITSIPHVDEFVGVLAPPRMMHEIGRMAKAGEDYKEMTLLMRDIFWQSFWRRSMRTQLILLNPLNWFAVKRQSQSIKYKVMLKPVT